MTREQAQALAAFISTHDTRFHKVQQLILFKRGTESVVQVEAMRLNGSVAEYTEIAGYITEAQATVEDATFQTALQIFAKEQQKGGE